MFKFVLWKWKITSSADLCFLPTFGTRGFHTVGILTTDQLQGQEFSYIFHYLR